MELKWCQKNYSRINMSYVFPYTIMGYSSNEGVITMQFKNNENIVEVNLSQDFPGYCCGDIINSYYKINGNNNDIVRIDPPYNSRVVIVDGDTVYTQISQWELDRYESHDVNSDNGKLYNYLQEKFSTI
tara:strand:- start:190 stop:576 length:387 start_codon:yes stop_codon:yes gene_type:complete